MSSGPSIEAAPYLTPVLEQSGVITAAAETVPGGGRAYVLASPFPLSNDGLRDGDSATLVLALLERARGAVPVFGGKVRRLLDEGGSRRHDSGARRAAGGSGFFGSDLLQQIAQAGETLGLSQLRSPPCAWR